MQALVDDGATVRHASSWAASTSLALLVIQNSISLVLLHAVQQPTDAHADRYEPLTAIILSEALKLFLSVSFLAFDARSLTESDEPPRSFVERLREGHPKSCPPAVLYTAAAAFQSIGARHLDGLSFVVLSQLKLLLTPLFSMLVLRQRLTILQWMFLLMMTAGIILVQPATLDPSSMGKQSDHRALLGFVSMFASGTCVALAGVIMETMLKTPGKFVVRNAQLSAYGCFCAILGLLARPALSITGSGGSHHQSFFHGYHALVWTLVVLQAAGGFIVAWSVRVTSIVAKNYAQAIGFLVASLGPEMLSPQHLPLRTWLGITCVVFGVVGLLGNAGVLKRKASAERSGSAIDSEKAMENMPIPGVDYPHSRR